MAIEPQVFLCYGRPDKDVAHEIAAEFWRNRIECYNYMSKPVEDRLENEIDHRGYIFATRLFIAILSEESVARFLVAEELAIANQVATMLAGRLFRAYVSLLPSARNNSAGQPDLVVLWSNSDGAPSVVSNLLHKMGPEFVERNQKAWEINKNLYAEKWRELNEKYCPDRQPTSKIAR